MHGYLALWVEIVFDEIEDDEWNNNSMNDDSSECVYVCVRIVLLLANLILVVYLILRLRTNFHVISVTFYFHDSAQIWNLEFGVLPK